MKNSINHSQLKSLDKLQEIYRSSIENVRSASYSNETAWKSFERYINFVCCAESSKGNLLDVGCGSGWSSYLFSQKGYLTTGIDLNAQAFEPPTAHNLKFIEGSVLNLPFKDALFDVVTSYQMLEHVPDPEKALLEMLRVLKPGGTFCLVGPNCLGLSISLKAISIYVWKNRPLNTIFIRTPGMAKHPQGNTLPEILSILPLNLFRLLIKTIQRKASFTMREPDLVPPFEGDNDACYLCNPIDIIRFLTFNNYVILQNGYYGRLPFTTWIAGGTWIAAQKS